VPALASAAVDLLRKSHGASPERSHRWNKNVLLDEKGDNDVGVGAAAAHAASPPLLRSAGHAPDAWSVAHIRRPLRLSEHKCLIATECQRSAAVEPRHTAARHL